MLVAAVNAASSARFLFENTDIHPPTLAICKRVCDPAPDRIGALPPYDDAGDSQSFAGYKRGGVLIFATLQLQFCNT
jgi:hypothetical protein